MLNKKYSISIIIILFISGLAIGEFLNKIFFLTKNNIEQLSESKDLSDKDYEAVKKEFLDITNTQDPKFALAELRERVKTDNPLLRSCHILVHEIGRAAYKKYGDFGEAIKYQDEICNSGYLHGIIEAYFSKSKDVFTAMKTVCSSYPLGKFLSWECYHGVGHGVMYYTSNDLNKSLELCDKYNSSFARENCANGVFMENFNTDQKLHPSKFLKESDPFYPCNEQSSRYKGACYLYAPTYYLSLNKNDYIGALNWCKSAEATYQNTCIQGVGSQTIKENINDPKFVEKICMGGNPSQINPCIIGMVGLYINHYGALEPAEKLCEQLEATNRKSCYKSIESVSGLFN